MFFVTVKTNVGYTPIADFVEALKVIASWMVSTIHTL